MKKEVWDSLIASLQSGQCVLVLGPEIPARLRSTSAANGEVRSLREAFCDYLATSLKEENERVGELALFAVAQQYEDSPAFSTVNLRNVAATYFRDPGHRPGPLHVQLARFPFSLILTTCHDDVFAKAIKEHGNEPTRYLYHYQGEPRDQRDLERVPEPQSPAIYHLFGAYDEPNSLVLTENDLLDFAIHIISGRPKLPDGLRSALRNKTFLFVGFGIKHWYIRVLLKLLVRTLELSKGSVVLESLGDLNDSEREQTVLFYKRGTRIEVVDMQVEAFLDELWQSFQGAGGYLRTTPRRIRRAQVFISYERSDEEMARRLYDAFPKDQFDSWLDRELLQGGEDWNSEIEQKIQSSDYFLVLNSENLARKQIGYVNKEVVLALDQQKYRQPGTKFIIPVQLYGIPPGQGRADLQLFQQMPLRIESLDEDLLQIVKTMSRDFQLRMR